MKCFALVWVGVLSVCFACSKPDKIKNASQIALPKIVRFQMEGNTRFRDQEIFSRIDSGPPPRLSLVERPRFDEVSFEVDLARIKALYRSVGYFSTKILSYEVKPLKKNKVKIELVIDEGEPVHIRALHLKIENIDTLSPEVEDYVTGRSKSFPEEAKLEASEEDSGILVHANYLRAREELLERFLEKGYAQANVKGEVRVDIETNKAQVFLEVNPGPVSVFGNVRFEGLKRISEKDLKDFILFEKGERFNYQKTLETKRNLFDTGNFVAVTIEPIFIPGQPETDIFIQVEEAKEYRVQFGGGAGIDGTGRSDAHLRAGWLDRSFLGGLRKLRVSGSLGFSFAEGSIAPLGDVSLSLSQPSFLANRQTLSGAVGVVIDSPSNNLLTITPKLRIGIDRDLSHLIKGLSYGFGYSFQLIQLCFLSPDDASLCAQGGDLDIDALLALGLAENSQTFRLGFLDQHVSLNRTDNPVDPRFGYSLSVNLHEGFAFLAFASGSEDGQGFNYFRIVPEVRGYLPLSRNRHLVLASRLQLGLLAPLGNDVASPFPERFFLGGAASHRGFGFQGLSPKERFTGNEEVAIGGNGMLLGSLELRLDLPNLLKLISFPGELRLAAFGEIGAVAPEIEALFPLRLPSGTQVDEGTLRPALGGGIRYVYGPIIIRLDLAHLLGTRLAAEREFVFHLSVGEAF